MLADQGRDGVVERGWRGFQGGKIEEGRAGIVGEESVVAAMVGVVVVVVVEDGEVPGAAVVVG